MSRPSDVAAPLVQDGSSCVKGHGHACFYYHCVRDMPVAGGGVVTMPSQDRPPAQGAPPPAQAAPPSASAPAAEEPRERHASWLELFFDLVVIAAVAQLADRLHGDPSPVDVGLAVVLYVAVWLAWTSFMLYANVSATQTRQQAMLGGWPASP
jgi:hypothetical protein